MTELHAKSLHLRVKAASAPTSDQLAAINTFTLREFDAEQIVVREYVLAHNAIDRDQECFAPALLDDFARTLPGKGVFSEGHPGGWSGSGGPAEGKVFAATTERMSFDAAKLLLREPKLVWPPDAAEAVVVRANAYFVKTPANESFLIKTDAGIGCDVSIGFNASQPERLKDSNGIGLDVWRWVAPGEALELSHVWLGAQPGARATKNANRSENEMDPKDKSIADLTAERDTLKAAAGDNAKAATTLAAVKAALGDNAKLLDDPVALGKAVADGQAHRKSLIDSIVTYDRQQKLCGDDDAAVKAHAEMYSGMPTAHLAALRDLAEKRATGRGGGAPTGAVRPGDPNTGAPGAVTKGAEGTPLGNPCIGG